eukprot:4188872-Pyramimonas_sp.AAC.1
MRSRGGAARTARSRSARWTARWGRTRVPGGTTAAATRALRAQGKSLAHGPAGAGPLSACAKFSTMDGLLQKPG